MINLRFETLVLCSGLAAVLLAAPALAAEPPHVKDSSFTEPSGERVLQESIVVEAPADCAWKAFTDEATIRAWNAPLVHVDLRGGGTIEESYDAKATLGGPQTIRQRIITYLPGRLLVLRNISAPPGLPGADLYPTIVQIVTLDPLSDSQTLVTLSGAGYGAGDRYDRLYGFLRQGNAEYLASLKALCEAAPAIAAPAAPAAPPPPPGRSRR
ncbi:MAG: SRPBCC family protein [Caulobacteraceae bacterium]